MNHRPSARTRKSTSASVAPICPTSRVWEICAGAASVLRRDIAGYVKRHAQEGSDLVGAELICAELINNAIENSDSPVWVSLDWGARRPVLAVNDLGVGFELPADVAMRFGRVARRSWSRHRDPPHR